MDQQREQQGYRPDHQIMAEHQPRSIASGQIQIQLIGVGEDHQGHADQDRVAEENRDRTTVLAQQKVRAGHRFGEDYMDRTPTKIIGHRS